MGRVGRVRYKSSSPTYVVGAEGMVRVGRVIIIIITPRLTFATFVVGSNRYYGPVHLPGASLYRPLLY